MICKIGSWTCSRRDTHSIAISTERARPQFCNGKMGHYQSSNHPSGTHVRNLTKTNKSTASIDNNNNNTNTTTTTTTTTTTNTNTNTNSNNNNNTNTNTNTNTTTTNNNNKQQQTTNNNKQQQTTTNNNKQQQTTTNNNKQQQTTTTTMTMSLSLSLSLSLSVSRHRAIPPRSRHCATQPVEPRAWTKASAAWSSPDVPRNGRFNNGYMLTMGMYNGNMIYIYIYTWLYIINFMYY